MNLHSELEKIRAENGGLTRQTVVDAARPKRAPLHDQFTWDDRLAGEQFRLIEAGNLIRRVGLRVIDEPSGGPVTLRRYWPVVDEALSTRSYEPLDEIADDPVRAQLLLDRLDREWRAFRRRWQHVSGFVDRINRDLAG
jgi:hypothetical protein